MRRVLLTLAALLGLGLSLNASAATLYLTEFSSVGTVTWQAAQMPAAVNQTVAIGGSSAQSAAFGSSTILIRVECDSVCSVAIGGTNPTATATSMRMAAGVPEYFTVKAGDKLAVISNT